MALTGAANTFLTSRIDSYANGLPSERVYPKGKRMLFSGWNPSGPTQVQTMHDYGFTAIGPWQNQWPHINTSIAPSCRKARDLKMRSIHELEPLGSYVDDTCTKLKSYSFSEMLASNTVGMYNQWLSKNPTRGAEADGIYDTLDQINIHPEELANRYALGVCGTIQSKLRDFNNYMIDTIQGWDGGRIDIARSENWNGWTNGNPYGNKTYNGRLTTITAQMYNVKLSNLAQIQSDYNMNVAMMAQLDKDAPLSTGQKRALTILPDNLYEPTDSSDAWLKKYSRLYFYIGIIKGAKCFQIYRLNQGPAGGRLQTAHFETVKELTDGNLDKAFMLGVNPPSSKLVISQTSGPTSISGYNAVPLQKAERQWLRERYVIITNSAQTSSIGIRVSGLPNDSSQTQIEIIDLRNGNKVSFSGGYFNVSIEAAGYRIYRIQEKGVSSVSKPVVGAASPASQTKDLGGTATFTASVSGATLGQHWQQLIAGAANWTDLSTTTTTLTLQNIAESLNGAKFRMWAKNAQGITTGTAGTLNITIPSTLVISKIKVSGTWKNMLNAYVKVSGIWKQITDVKLKVNGVWRTSSFGTHLMGPSITTQPRLNASYVEGGTTPTLSVVATPASTTYQWQWRNPAANKHTFVNISGATSKSYKIIDRGAGLTVAQNDDRFLVRVRHDGITLNSSEVKLVVTPKPIVELVKNGTFTSNYTYWAATQVGGLSIDAGRLKIINKTGPRSGALQLISTGVTAGKKYKVSIVFAANKWCSLAVEIGATAYNDSLGLIWATEPRTTPYTETVVATSNKIYLNVRVGTTEIDRFVIVDNVSVKEV